MTARALSIVVAAAASFIGACGPRISALPGVPAPLALPRAEIPQGHTRLVFTWNLQDAELSARGEGAARLAFPDSARLDFFLAGGLGSGAAVLIREELRLPDLGADIARRLVPPPPLLWASLGRFAVPSLPDTTVRVDGDTLRADIGRPVTWRATFVNGTLRRLDRIDDGRIVEWVQRESGALDASHRARYRHERSRRQLDIAITRRDHSAPFDASIWVF